MGGRVCRSDVTYIGLSLCWSQETPKRPTGEGSDDAKKTSGRNWTTAKCSLDATRAHNEEEEEENKKKGGEEEAKANKNDVVDQDDGLFRSKKRERRKGVEKSREKADKRLALL